LSDAFHVRVISDSESTGYLSTEIHLAGSVTSGTSVESDILTSISLKSNVYSDSTSILDTSKLLVYKTGTKVIVPVYDTFTFILSDKNLISIENNLSETRVLPEETKINISADVSLIKSLAQTSTIKVPPNID
jgi:hypothetical protein